MVEGGVVMTEEEKILALNLRLTEVDNEIAALLLERNKCLELKGVSLVAKDGINSE